MRGVAQSGLRPPVQVVDGPVFEEHASARGAFQPREGVEQRRLARARSADEKHRLAGWNLERDAAQHVEPAVADSKGLPQVFGANDGGWLGGGRVDAGNVKGRRVDARSCSAVGPVLSVRGMSAAPRAG